MPRSEAELFSILIDYVRRERGVDFSAYKDASLKRRLHRRMQQSGMDSYGDYLDYIQATPQEMNELLDSVFINVTRFFRDEDTWAALRELLPDLLARRPGAAPLRVWCAGASSGQEAYTIAMLLGELMTPPEFVARVKIFATDIDDAALAQARLGSYTAQQVEDVPPELREKYFEIEGDRYTFRPDHRRCVIFGKHNLLEDAPISRIDLLSCRNTIMYFNREAQARILSRFHFALRDDGLMLLGKAEMLLTRREMFEALSGKVRLFRKSAPTSLRDHLSLADEQLPDAEPHPMLQQIQLRAVAFEGAPVAQIIVDAELRLVAVNGAARTTFGLRKRDVGRSFAEMDLSYRPVELRSLIDEAVRERRLVRVESAGSDTAWFDVQVMPVHEGDRYLGATISFLDLTHAHQLRDQLDQSRSELETAYEELQSTNEELETTNEELQSTVEELETTNEELQSTNEELETMNEELYSTNEEIRAINDQLDDRSGEVHRLNGRLRSILDSVGAAVVVVDRELAVTMWNTQAAELWGLRGEETSGRSFLNLDIGLPVLELRDAMRRCLRGDSVADGIALNAHNRRGKSFECRVSCSPLLEGEEVGGVILMMEPVMETAG